jgi:hypothetical protein
VPVLLLTPRSRDGLASAALLARYLRLYLLEDVELTPRELRFTDEGRVGALLLELATVHEPPATAGGNGSSDTRLPQPTALTRVVVAGVGVPENAPAAAEAVERFTFFGVEVDWYDHRPWPAVEAAALGRHANLVLAPRPLPSGAQFLWDALRLDDHRSRAIVDLALPLAERVVAGCAETEWMERWHYLLSALALEENLPRVRAVLRRLAFLPGLVEPLEGDEAIVREELDRRRWLARDFRLSLPFPVAQTRTRQPLALVDLRREAGVPALDVTAVAHTVARSQRVRYTLVATASGRGWTGFLHSWPADIGDLARVPALAAMDGDRFLRRFEARHRARFWPRDPAEPFQTLAHELAARL